MTLDTAAMAVAVSLTPPPRPAARSRRLSVRLAPTEWQQLQEVAAASGAAPSTVVHHLLRQALDQAEAA